MKNDRVYILRESVVKITQMLSGKGIKVTQQGVNAYVKADHRGVPVVVNLPYLPDNATEELCNAIQGFLDHEVAHILFTDFTLMGKAMKQGRQVGFLLNALEDPRIEKCMAERFQGSAYNLSVTGKFYLDKFITPKMQEAAAKGDANGVINVLMVPMIRALSGQQVFKEFMKDHWTKVAPVYERIKDLQSKIENAASTADCLALAEEISKRMQSDSDGSGGKGKNKSESSSSSKGSKSKSKGGDSEGEGESKSSGSGKAEPDDEGESSKAGTKPKSEPKKEEKEEEGAGAGEDEKEDEKEEPKKDEKGAGEDKEDEGEGEKEEPKASDGEGEDEKEGGEPEPEPAPEPEADPEGEDEAPAEEPDPEEEKDDGEGAGDSDPEAADDTETNLDSSKPIWDELDKDGANGYDESMSRIITQSTVDAAKDADYVIFTKEYDVIEKLPIGSGYDSKMTQRLIDAVDHMVAPLQKDLERAVAARSLAQRSHGHRSGKLHSSNLTRLRFGDDRVFSRKHESESKDVAVELVVDCSGSMSGSKIHTACQAAYALSAVLERLNIKNEVIGFTTKGIGGAQEEMYKQQSATGIRFSRVEGIYMPILKGFDERMTANVQERFGWLPNTNILRSNVDGESVEVAARRLLQRREHSKVMIVLSDGYPAAAGSGNLNAHLKKVTKEIEAAGIRLVGIGIESEAVKQFYSKNLVLHKVTELPEAVMKQLRHLLMV